MVLATRLPKSLTCIAAAPATQTSTLQEIASNSRKVDSSSASVDLAVENATLNNLAPERISFLREDATAFMKESVRRKDLWDIVVLDPPKLAPREKFLRSASGMYKNLNSLMRVTKKGGLLMTCSCSVTVAQSRTFLHTLQDAASNAGRKITVVRQAGAAFDHPIDPSYPQKVNACQTSCLEFCRTIY